MWRKMKWGKHFNANIPIEFPVWNDEKNAMNLDENNQKKKRFQKFYYDFALSLIEAGM